MQELLWVRAQHSAVGTWLPCYCHRELGGCGWVQPGFAYWAGSAAGGTAGQP